MKNGVKRTVVIASITVTVILVCVVLLIVLCNPQRIFSRRFGFKLPKQVRIVRYSYNPISDEAKYNIELSPSENDDLLVKLNKFYSDAGNEIKLTPSGEFPYNEDWWTDKTEVYVWGCDKTVEGSRGAKSRTVRTIITQSENGLYHLYISF